LTVRVRREPPAFREVHVDGVEDVSPRLTRVTIRGAALAGFPEPEPAASVRLLLPPTGADELVVPAWNGNEFLVADGSRPTIRTLTPRRWDDASASLSVDVVRHGTGAVSDWVAGTTPGSPVAVSGPGRGYAIDGETPAFVLAGDDTAIPAMSQLLEVIPPDRTVDVHVEIAHPDARHALPAHPRATVEWYDLAPGSTPGTALVAAVHAAAITDDARVWVAGEAAAVHRIRRHLFDERGITRSRATVRGYWKHGRVAGNDD
jgi:NADPH-dependent ferric siderophore reductase